MKSSTFFMFFVFTAIIGFQSNTGNCLTPDNKKTDNRKEVNYHDRYFFGKNINRETIFLEEFTSDLGTFNEYSVIGYQKWEWAYFDNGCAKMNGFSQGTNYVNEDWFISPSISLEGHSGVILEYREAINYITSHDDLKVLISTDYTGYGDPNSYGTWTELTGFNRAPGNNWNFYNSGDISLADYEGQVIYVAFKYLSTSFASSVWEVSRFEIRTDSFYFEDLEFGTDSTFDIMTWNIQTFPKYGETTMNYVCEIIHQMNMDIIALQEIDTLAHFIQMITNCSGWEAWTITNSSLAYIYNPETVEVSSAYRIYTNYSWEFPRPPLLMELIFMDQEYIIINNHLKAGSDSTSKERRRAACNLLDEYITNYLYDKKVILLGDLNDEITEEPPYNVFEVFIDKPDIYYFADMEIASGDPAFWSFPNYPSHIDHILVTNELFYVFDQESTLVATILLDEYFPNGWNQYYTNVSDHRPVAMKFVPDATTTINNLVSEEVTCAIFPNPFNQLTTITFQSPSKNGMVVIYDLTGRMVEEFEISGGQTSLQWDTGRLPEGIYYVKIKTDSGTNASMKAIKLK